MRRSKNRGKEDDWGGKGGERETERHRGTAKGLKGEVDKSVSAEVE